ncbi:hypothetical protein BYT27DRAFT_7208214 [Phlegmacium glaucopus]|nr:hypothetical protein BYT27DRAFT_7208214 [Phlegmacium glaucopus]
MDNMREYRQKLAFMPPTTDLVLPPYFARDDRQSYNPLSPSKVSLQALYLETPSEDLGEGALTGSDTNHHIKPAPAPAHSLPSVSPPHHPAHVEASQQQGLELGLVWSDSDTSSGNERLAPAPAPAPAPALLLTTDWNNSDEDDSVQDVSPPGPIQNPLSPGVVPLLFLADEWKDSDEESSHGVSTLSLAHTHPVPVSDNEGPAGPTPPLVLNLADSWSSSSQGSDQSSTMDDDRASSPYTVRSPLVVSPSQITLNHSSASFLDMDTHFPLLDDLPPAATPAVSCPPGPYGPEHFAYLQDDMFEGDSSDKE